MNTIEAYMRATEMINNLKLNLHDLNDYRQMLLSELYKVDKQIDKHESFIKILEEDIEI